MSVVQHKRETTRIGGVTGRGFMPGQSGNPGGRPKGLSRRVRELVGDDGHEIAEYMFSVLSDDRERTADRMEAAKWLADRGFGKAPIELDVDLEVTKEAVRVLLRSYSTEDLETMRDIHMKYVPDAVEALEESGEFGVGSAVASSRQR